MEKRMGQIMFNPSTMCLVLDSGEQIDSEWGIEEVSIRPDKLAATVKLRLFETPHQFSDMYEYELAKTTEKFVGTFYLPHGDSTTVGILAKGRVTSMKQLIKFNCWQDFDQVGYMGSMHRVATSQNLTMTLLLPIYRG